MLLLAALAAHASVYTAEDLVFAWSTNLPLATGARIAEAVGTDRRTAVYLLRRGVGASTLAAWGYDVSEDERAEALRLGPLAAPAPRVSDADWREITELPTGIERVAGAPVSGTVVAVVPTHAVLENRDVAFLVERGEARDVWVDGRPLTSVLYEDDVEEPLPTTSLREMHLRRGHVAVGAGAALAVAGGISLLAGVKGNSPGFIETRTCCVGAMEQTWIVEQVPNVPNLPLMGVGALGLLGASLSFHFGAQELRLAGAHPGGWEPPERE